MTILVTRHPYAVTARVTTAPAVPGTPPPAHHTPTGPHRDAFTVTAYLNAAPDHFRGYRPGHTVAEATRPDGTPLRLTFTLGRASSAHVGNHHTSDDHGQDWPADVRLLSKGDVLRVTAPDGVTSHLAIASPAFCTVTPPTDHIHLAATSATTRRAFCWQPGNLAAAGALVGYLMANGTAFDHPSGTGATTLLRLRLPGCDLPVQPGQWLVHADTGHWQVVTAHAFARGQPL